MASVESRARPGRVVLLMNAFGCLVAATSLVPSWCGASCARIPRRFPPSMKFACRDENDNLVAERAGRKRIRCAGARFAVDWLASDRGVAFGCNFLPQPARTLGVHVVAVVRHFFQPEVADVVESADPSFSSGLAFAGLSFRLAGDGCGLVPGCERARSAASIYGVALGDARNGPWRGPDVDSGAIASRRRTTAARVDGHVGIDPAAALRVVPVDCSCVADFGC